MRADAEWLRARLLEWFRCEARELPWRSDPTPYRVMLSELMLQQTRVDTVLPYFARFTERWPTLSDLAAASEEEVLQMWAGLGYYRRARNLLRAAVEAEEGGGLRGSVEALRALPGIGPYTAGAIASIAFGVPAAAVDGNVERVISRVDGRQEDPRKAAGKRALTERALEITAPGVASEVTQGLMELGALVCTPRSPRCGGCPWHSGCVARQQGTAEQLPRLPKRRKPTPVRGVAGLLQRGGRVLLGRRPPGLLGGLWEPLMDELGAGERSEDAVRRVFRERAGVELVGVVPRGSIVHVFTHRRLALEVFEVHTSAEPALGEGYEALGWLDQQPLSKLALKVLGRLQAPSPHLQVAAERGGAYRTEDSA